MTPVLTSPPTPRRRLRPVAVLAAAVAIAIGSYGLDRLAGILPGPANGPVATLTAREPLAPAPAAPPAAPARDVPLAPPGDDPVVVTSATADLDKAIGVWTANLARDPEDFVSAQNLALDYYTRGRLTGNVDDYARAREAVDQGLIAYPDDRGSQTLRALLLYTLHDFVGARAAAQAVYDADPSQLQALATVGDSQLELGEYDAAATVYDTLARSEPGAAVSARLARLAALRGQDAEARRLASRATAEAVAEGTTGTGFAFYDYLEGYLAFQAGDLARAATGYEAALRAWSGSYQALEGLARVRAAEGRTDEAIALYQKAIAIVPQPEFLAGLGDLYQLTGRPAEAEEQYATVRAIARLQAAGAQVFNRQLVLFEANHGTDPAGALGLAERELAVRADIYGWDAKAWALLANGRAAEADAAMSHALALGTNDALLAYHAGMIAAALHDDARSRALLGRALELNPGFDPLQARRARDTLAALGTP